MKVQLPLYSSFLRISFAKTRKVLAGRKPLVKIKPILSMDLGNKHQNKSKKAVLAKAVNVFLLLIAVLCLTAAALLMLPDVYYQVFPADVEPIVSLEKGSAFGGEFEEGAKNKNELEKTVVLPVKNENLPQGDWLIIPRIGVRTEVRSTSEPEIALQQGVWMSPDYGKPGDEYELPIILAAHRFGWEWWWQSDYWKYNSFYSLPDLEPGDMVEIIVDQRKWVYEIYAGEQGQEISDYEADLILYTCKFLNSPVRHFRYARLINLSQDTQ